MHALVVLLSRLLDIIPDLGQNKDLQSLAPALMVSFNYPVSLKLARVVRGCCAL
jgi:hypothetical protein